MGEITDSANDAFRDYEVSGLPSSGAHEPVKAEIRTTFGVVEIVLSSAVSGLVVGSAVSYATRAELYADLLHAANTLGVVFNDGTAAYNGVYVKSGGSGTGAWTLTGLVLPSTFAADLAEVLAAVQGIPAAVEATAADAEQTAADRVATAADRVQTGLDAAATAADRTATHADRLATATAASEAVAAAEASGDIHFVRTYAEATEDLGELDDGQVVEVNADETLNGNRSRYRVESSALAFLRTLGADAWIEQDDPPDPDQGVPGQLLLAKNVGGDGRIYTMKQADGWPFSYFNIGPMLTEVPLPGESFFEGLWYAADAETTANGVRLIPNALSAVALPNNLLPVPMRHFAGPHYSQVSLTITDLYATDSQARPLSAARLQCTDGGPWDLYPSGLNLDPGTDYKIHIRLKSNTGDTYAAKLRNNTTGDVIAITPAWETFVSTAFPGDETPLVLLIGSTNVDILIEWAQIVEDGVAADPVAFGGHMLLGTYPGQATPAVTDDLLVSETSARAVIQFEEPLDLTGFTLWTVAKLTQDIDYYGFFEDVVSPDRLYVSAHWRLPPLDGASARVLWDLGDKYLQQPPGFFELYGLDQFHFIGVRLTTTTVTWFIDNLAVYNEALATNGRSVQDLYAAGGGVLGGMQESVKGFLSQAMSDSQVGQLVNYLMADPKVETITRLERVVIAAGDSITGENTPTSYTAYPFGSLPDLNDPGEGGRPTQGLMLAKSGYYLHNIIAQATTYAYPLMATKRADQVLVYAFNGGGNDVSFFYEHQEDSRQVWFDAMVAHLRDMRNRGFVVGWAPIGPRTHGSSVLGIPANPDFNIDRNWSNDQILAMEGDAWDFLIPFHEETWYDDAAPDDTGLYSDKIHPVQAVQDLMRGIWVTAINAATGS